jgi:hypothetical protein
LSFFSIMRLVISSVSGDTVSWRSLRGRRAGPPAAACCRAFGEQRLLALLGHALALGHLHHTGSIITGVGWCSSISIALFEHHLLALARGRWPTARSCATSRFSRRDSNGTVNPRTQPLGHLAPGKPEHQRRAQHQSQWPDQARARKTQPLARHGPTR